MTIRGIIFDLGSTLMYFDGDWRDVVGRGAANMAAFFTRKRVKLDEAALAEAFIAERRAGREVAYRTDREVTCAESLRAALEKVSALPQAGTLVPEAVRVYFEPEEAAWKAYPPSEVGTDFIYNSGYNAEEIIFRARIPMILISLLLAIFVYICPNLSSIKQETRFLSRASGIVF